MIDFCIVGSGIAGSTIAKLLSKKYSVKILDKAKGVGGRSSNRRYDDKLNFDHGLQYISPKNGEFKKFIKYLEKKDVIKEWTGPHLDFLFKKKKNSKKYIGSKSNNSIVKYLLQNQDVSLNNAVKKIIFKNDHWTVSLNNGDKINFRNIVLTCPYLQTKNLTSKYLGKKILDLNVKMEPNITLMIVLKNGNRIPLSSINLNDEVIAWISNENSKKRFKSNLNLLTVQSQVKWAKKYINIHKEDKHKVILKMLNKISNLFDIDKKKIIFKNIHGWKYSYNISKTKYKSIWHKKYRLGVCGDWFMGPKAEHAWLSAKDIYKKINR